MAKQTEIAVVFKAYHAEMTQGLEKVQRELNNVKRTSDSARTSMTTLGSAMRTFLPAVSIVGLGAWVKRTIDAADAMRDMGNKVGMTTAEIFKLSRAAEFSGVSQDTLINATAKLNKEIGKQPELFKKLGISAKGGAEGLVQSLQVLDRIESPTARAAVASMFFSKSYKDMLPILADGSDAFAKNMKDAEDAAIEYEKFAETADRFNDNMTVIANNMGDLSITMFTPLLDGLTTLTGAFLANMKQAGFWVTALRSAASVGRSIWSSLKEDTNENRNKQIKTLELMIADPKVSDNLKVGYRQQLAVYKKNRAEAQKELDEIYKNDVFLQVANDPKYSITTAKLKKVKPVDPEDILGGGKKKKDSEGDKIWEKMVKLAEQYKDKLDAIRDPAAEFNKQIAETEELFSRGLITQQEYADLFINFSVEAQKAYAEAGKAASTYEEKIKRASTFQDAATLGLEKYRESAKSTAEQVADVFTNAFQSMEDALVQFVSTGKLDFKSLVQSILADIARIQIRKNITGPLSSWLGSDDGGGGFLSSLGDWLGIGGGSGGGSAFDGGGMSAWYSDAGTMEYANGGSASPGIYSISERGDEIVTAHNKSYLVTRNGADIAPVQQTGGSDSSGGGVTVVQNINVDSRADQASIIQAMEYAKNAAKAEIQDDMRRNKGIGKGR